MRVHTAQSHATAADDRPAMTPFRSFTAAAFKVTPSVRRHALDAALDHPTTVARQLGLAALSPVCQKCMVPRRLRRRLLSAPLSCG
jgi:hypothetical protein